LATDDADTVEPGRLEFNAGWALSRDPSATTHSMAFNPVLGLSSRGEFGLTFGYQWLDGRGSESDAQGATDVTFSSKWFLWEPVCERLKLSMRFDLKLPTAPAADGLGTGDPDAGVVLCATWSWHSTDLDVNVGYTATDASRRVFREAQWFLGLAARHPLSERWSVVGESYALLPHGEAAPARAAYFSGGAQLVIRKDLLLSGLVGTSVGRERSDLTATLGFTRLF